MMKSTKTKLFTSLSVAVMSLSIVMPCCVGVAQAQTQTTKTVYIDVEKDVLHQNVLLQPVAVTLPTTDTILDATEQVYGAGNVDASSGYVEAFADTDTSYTYDYTSAINTATNGVVYRTDLPNQPIVSDSNWLRGTEYDGISGWMFTVNNETTFNGGGSWYTASTPLSDLPDGAVIRWEFSEAAGADLGMSGVYLPTQVTAAGYYDWTNNTVSFPARFTRADKTNLIADMAEFVNKTDPAYTNALTVLENLTSTQSAVDAADAAL